jgi:hypothetical protein
MSMNAEHFQVRVSRFMSRVTAMLEEYGHQLATLQAVTTRLQKTCKQTVKCTHDKEEEKEETPKKKQHKQVHTVDVDPSSALSAREEEVLHSPTAGNGSAAMFSPLQDKIHTPVVQDTESLAAVPVARASVRYLLGERPPSYFPYSTDVIATMPGELLPASMRPDIYSATPVYLNHDDVELIGAYGRARGRMYHIRLYGTEAFGTSRALADLYGVSVAMLRNRLRVARQVLLANGGTCD